VRLRTLHVVSAYAQDFSRWRAKITSLAGSEERSIYCYKAVYPNRFTTDYLGRLKGLQYSDYTWTPCGWGLDVGLRTIM